MKSIFFLSFLGTVLSARSESIDTCFKYNKFQICQRSNDLLNVTDTLGFNESYNIFDWDQLKLSNISSTGNNAFNNLTRVGKLKIYGDEEKLIITSKSFRGLPSLIRLFISSFHLSSESLIFHELTNLNYLHLDKIIGNNGSLELTLPSTLEYLGISNTNLKNLNGNKFFSNSKNLQHLKLDNTNISSLELQVISSLTKLKSLSLCENNLETFDLDIFSQLKNFNALDLTSNKFEKIPSGITEKIPGLEYLYMGNNNIKVIDGNLFPSTIKIIDLSGNQIFDIKDDAFSGLDLFELNLSSNMLRNIEYKMFRGLKALTFHLSNNNVTKIANNAFNETNIEFYLTLNSIENANNVVITTAWGLPNTTIRYGYQHTLPFKFGFETCF